MKKLLLLPVVLFGAFTVATAQAPVATPQTDNPNAAQMKFDGMEYQFGNIKQGEVATHEFRFKNTGKEPLIISSATGSCGCTVPDWPHDPTNPGQTAVIKVTFNSTGKMGQQDKTVTIVSNAKEGTLVLHMKGTVEAKPVETPTTTGSGTAAAPATTTSTTPAATTSTAPAKDSKSTTTAPATTGAKATPKAKSKSSKAATTKGNQ